MARQELETLRAALQGARQAAAAAHQSWRAAEAQASRLQEDLEACSEGQAGLRLALQEAEGRVQGLLGAQLQGGAGGLDGKVGRGGGGGRGSGQAGGRKGKGNAG